MIAVDELIDGIDSTYRNDPRVKLFKLSLCEREALLVAVTFSPSRSRWGTILSQITGQVVKADHQDSAAILIVRSNANDIWALTYGRGFHLIDDDKIDHSFGQRLALRCTDPERIISITRTILDRRSRTDRFSIPSGDHLMAFGIGEFGELVTRLEGEARIGSLTWGKRPLRLRGSDSLSVPLGITAEHLVRDLDVLANTLKQPPLQGFEMLEHLALVRRPSQPTRELDRRLGQALEDPQHPGLGLAWPHARVDEYATPNSFRITGGGRKRLHDGTPALEHILERVRDVDADQRLRLLKERVRIQLFVDADGQQAMSRSIRALSWITFETELDDRRYCLYDGNWYRMDQSYANNLKHQVQSILARQPDLKLPAWRSGWDEDTYNREAARAVNGILIHEKLIRTEFHRKGIELCDVYVPGGVLVHVKHYEKSADLSHLFAQAMVSAHALCYDEQARKELRRRIEAAGGDVNQVPIKPKQVVIALARKGGSIRSSDLFTFAQVMLVRHTAILRSQDIDVCVATVDMEEDCGSTESATVDRCTGGVGAGEGTPAYAPPA